MSAIQEIEKTVLALPVEQRVALAESLSSSLPQTGEVWSEADEMAEVERREHEIESDQTVLVAPLTKRGFASPFRMPCQFAGVILTSFSDLPGQRGR